MTHTLFRDPEGILHAEFPQDMRLLGRYLEADVQGSIELCDAALKAVDEVASGRRKRRELTGNAHTLALTAQKARITPEFSNHKPLECPLDTLRTVLQEWRELISRN
jgi:hypothetical protein